VKPLIFNQKESGMALATAIFMIVIVSVLGSTFISGIIYEGWNSQHWRKSTQAFYLAEAAAHKAVRLLREQEIEDFPYSESNVVLGNGRYDLGINIENWVINLDGVESDAYATETYKITTVGEVSGVKRGIEIGYKRDTFLRFSRYVQNADLNFDSNAEIDGDVLAGDDLNLGGYAVVFNEDVSFGDAISNEFNGVFLGNLTQDADPVDLQMSVNLDYYMNLALGNVPDKGTGVYLGSSSVIDLSLFDCSSGVPLYDGVALPNDFNGIVYVEGDAHVEGILEGQSLTVIASDDVVVTDHIRTGSTVNLDDWTQTDNISFNSQEGVEQIETVSLDDMITEKADYVVKLRTTGRKWNELKLELKEDGEVIGTTYLTRRAGSPNKAIEEQVMYEDDELTVLISSLSLDPSVHNYSATISYKSKGVGSNPTRVRVYKGEPVNLGLVAKDQVYIAPEAPKQLIVDSALLARDGSWHALGDDLTHPDEYDSSWQLSIKGPIITAVGGSSGPWSAFGGTREYNYDEDILSNPPPSFPVPINGCTYWKEIKPKNI